MTQRPQDLAVDPAEVVAAAVTAVPGVEGLHPGSVGEVATYLPGKRIKGVRLHDSGCEVHVTLRWGAPVVATSQAVREAVRPLVTGAVDVVVEDIADPTTDLP